VLETIYEEFRQRSDEQPDAQALRWGGTQITYAQLDERAAALAAHLAKSGVATGQLVGIATSRGPALVVAMLAVMRAGAAWVPLDPAYPFARLRHMIEDSGVSLVLTDSSASAKLPPGLVCIDVDKARQDAAPIASAVSPLPKARDLAYVIYTSGSTGKPKGVLIEHGSVAATVRGMRDAFGVKRGDHVLQFSSMSFDASICEIGIALTAGAALVIVGDDARLPGVELMSLLDREKVSIAVLPPSVVAALPEGDLSHLRTLVCAGEALPTELAYRWGRGRRLINAYGPTEVAICATAGEVSSDAGRGKPDIGHPLPGVDVYILDAKLQPLPPGEIGELAVGGAGVGRGYLRQPQLTQERFVHSPRGERLYRTGDLARQLPSGAYDFIGRVDHQVKVNGFRIEPDEIAEVLRSHVAVQDAVVIALGGRLIAYVATGQIQIDELRQWCEERLPAHMVPSAVVVLKSLPLTPSGKVDRDALPAPDRLSAGLPEYRKGADTPTEAALTDIVRDLLGVRDVGIDDDFFALGGHSLLVGRLAAKIRAAFGVEIALNAIYRSPTVAAIAASIDGIGDAPTCAAPMPPALTKARRDGPIPLSFPQERIWFLEQIVPGNLAYQAQATLRIEGPLRVNALNVALTEIVRRHEIFRTAFKGDGGTPMQEIKEPFAVSVPVVELTGCGEEEFESRAATLIAEEIQRRFRPDEAPLVRWVLFRHSATRHILLHAEHHLIHDGWSFAVFIDELRALYEASLSGENFPLPEPTLQFADFAVWQRQWLSGATLGSYLNHWKDRLQNLPVPLSLPTDRPRSPAFRFSGDSIHENFSPQEYASLKQGARAHGVTLFTVMLAGFATLLSRYADQHDLIVGVGSANRRLAESERLIGMVINTLPLRVKLDDDPQFSEVLRRVHQTAVEGYAWQDVPLDRLVDALALQRDASRNPLFSVIFSFHDAAVPDLTFGGLKAKVHVEHNGSAKADLNIVVIPRAEQRVGRAASEEDQSLEIIWEYADDLFDRASMDAMLASYHRLLSAALSQPQLPVSRLPLTASSIEIPAEFKKDSIEPLLAKEMFAQWVATSPDETAVTDLSGRSLTYRELDQAAIALAQQLEGTRAPGEAQPALRARGLSLVVAVVASMKSGTPWVLDPDDPRVETVNWAELACAASALRNVGFAGRRVLQLAEIGNPVMILEIVCALFNGRSLSIVNAPLSDSQAVATMLLRQKESHGPYCTILPCALVNALAGRFPKALATAETLLAIGNDVNVHALGRTTLARVLIGQGFAASPLVLLGEWKASENAEAHEFTGIAGRPVKGINCAVLDRLRAPVPVGAAGILHIQSPGDQASRQSNWLVRQLADGRIQALNEGTKWLEVGGFRVNPGEACSALRTHAVVAEAAIATRNGQLVAYVVPRNGQTLGARDLLTYVGDRIAACQTPTAIVFLESLPLNAAGDLDPLALADPEATHVIQDGPLTPTEDRIAAMCSSLLGLEVVDPRADFFLLGGRSLLATRLVAQVNREFQTGVSVARFLRRPTVTDLAAAVDAAKGDDAQNQPRPSARRNAAALLADIDRLTDEEVKNLIEELKGTV